MRHFIKFWFYRYIESGRSKFEKTVLKVICWTLFEVLRVPHSVWSVVTKEIERNDFKTVIRRSQWLLRHSALKLELVKDRYFDFSIGLSSDAAKDLYSHMRLKTLDSDFDKEIVLAQLSSAVLESKLLPGEALYINKVGSHEYDAQFVGHINRALKIVDEVKQLNLDTQKKTTLRSARESFVIIDKHPNYTRSIGRNRFRESARIVFFDLLDLLDSLNMPTFAISGTMLGITREGDFLAHDNDIDIGIFESAFNLGTLEKGIRESKEYFIIKCDYPAFRYASDADGIYARRSTPTLIKIGHQSGVHTDLFVHIQKGDEYWHGSSLHGWINTSFELVPVKFFNRDILVPMNYDLYLTENYGEWRVPVSDFNCSTGTPNISLTNSCKSLCYFTKMAFDYYGNNLRANAIQIENQMIASGQFITSNNGALSYIGISSKSKTQDHEFYV